MFLKKYLEKRIQYSILSNCCNIRLFSGPAPVPVNLNVDVILPCFGLSKNVAHSLKLFLSIIVTNRVRKYSEREVFA